MAYRSWSIVKTSSLVQAYREMACKGDWKEVTEMPHETEETKLAWSVGGVCVPGGLLLGMGIGWALGYLVPGLLAGLGVGFLGMAVVVALMRRKAD
jgi:hypothetical protein